MKPYFETFTTRWPTVEALAAADDGEVMAAWAGLGYYARARNLLACARAVAGEHGGRFPDDEAALLKLPGIGAYTAAAIAAIAFGRRAVVVDANVERVVARLHAVEEPLPPARARIRALADAMTPDEGAGDFAQAMMDLGATICTPRSPDCGRCPLQRALRRLSRRASRSSTRSRRPRRPGRAARASPTGSSMTARSCSSAARRKGLLGGMLALPDRARPLDADWREAGAVDHVFTHFALTMTLLCAEARGAARRDLVAGRADRRGGPADPVRQAGGARRRMEGGGMTRARLHRRRPRPRRPSPARSRADRGD